MAANMVLVQVLYNTASHSIAPRAWYYSCSCSGSCPPPFLSYHNYCMHLRPSHRWVFPLHSEASRCHLGRCWSTWTTMTVSTTMLAQAACIVTRTSIVWQETASPRWIQYEFRILHWQLRPFVRCKNGWPLWLLNTTTWSWKWMIMTMTVATLLRQVLKDALNWQGIPQWHMSGFKYPSLHRPSRLHIGKSVTNWHYQTRTIAMGTRCHL
jgi:hypothetical protein